jgi:signal transduction histidine kinase
MCKKNYTLSGLSISHEIVKLHSGEISITSPLSSNEREHISLRDNLPGTCIKVCLPKKKTYNEKKIASYQSCRKTGWLGCI